MKHSFIRSALTLTLIASSLFGTAQFNDSPTLKIGDPAPAIQLKVWARGIPVDHFEKGQVYVLDFWATWCGGCIAMFPHISAVSEKYKGKVHFLSIDSYEQLGDHKDKDPVAVVTEFLKTRPGQRLTLDVGVDGNDTVMYHGWVSPLRRRGFPTTFVIDQDGKIAYIDVNLDRLDWILGEVLAKTWDRDKAAAIMQQKDALEDLMFSSFRVKEEEERNKIYQSLLAGCEAFRQQFPDRTDAVEFYQFMALAELDKAKVPALLEEMAANRLTPYINLSDAAGLTLRRTDLSKRDYIAIAKVQERLLQNKFTNEMHGGKSVAAYEELSDTYIKAGDPEKAITNLKKAIALANDQKAPASHLHHPSVRATKR